MEGTMFEVGIKPSFLFEHPDFYHLALLRLNQVGPVAYRKNVERFGSEKAEDRYSSLKNTVEDAMRKLFNPEFLNRVDETIVFRNLDKEDIMKIIDIELKDLLKNIKDNKMHFALDLSAKNFLVEKGFDQKFGARPLRRAIQKYVEDPIAEEILRGIFKEGSKILAKHYPPSEEMIFVDENYQEEVAGESKSDSTEGS